MPIKKSAKKYMRVTDRKTIKNRKVKGSFRSSIKKTREAVANKDNQTATAWLNKSIKALDKAIQKKVLKKNTGARYKSRLNKLVKNSTTKKEA